MRARFYLVIFSAVLALGSLAHAQIVRAPTRTPVRRGPSYQIESLGRGVIATNTGSNSVFVSWRALGVDPANLGFNLYRSSGGGPAVKLNVSPILDVTGFTDNTAILTQSNSYFVRPVMGIFELGDSKSFTLPANSPVGYFAINLDIPPGGNNPATSGTTAHSYTYRANDCSVGDLDGDGEYEIVVKWDPTDAKDNSQDGYTGNAILDAYRMDGTKLWRIDLGRNIRAGAHYTQFIVFDLDGDGRAEVACRTSDGSIDGVGNVIGNALADYRNTEGYILTGPEYLTIFDGLTGRALSTSNFFPNRVAVAQWGDTYGNRVDRFLAAVAYLDGVRPSLIMSRGYYGPQGGQTMSRNEITAYNWRNGELTQVWTFKAALGINGNINSDCIGQGNHQLSVADVDNDGKDEILYGALCIDDNGTKLFGTGLGHGDAYHVSDMDPDRPGLEVYGPHESPSSYGIYGSEMHDAMTGQILWGASGQNADVGRGVAFDIDPRYRGYEAWSSRGGLYSCKGVQITTVKPAVNFGVWWDGDLLRELLDGANNDGGTGNPPSITKWNWNNNSVSTLLSFTGAYSNNNTKATPALCADFMGDWREEVVLRSTNTAQLRIYSTPIPTNYRLYTLMHNRQYREAIAWQNSGYNQPPHPSFFLGDGMRLSRPHNI